MALTVLVAGCGVAGSERDDMDDKFAPLAQRPTIESIKMTYEGMQARLRDRLSAEVGPLRWVDDQNLSGAGCADFTGVSGESRTLDSWTSKGNLPDAQWDRAVQIVAEVTSEYGFGTPRVVVNRPNDHEITATDQYGGHYLFGIAANTVLMVSIGCHLPADAHPGAQ